MEAGEERGKGKMICVRKSAWKITCKDHPPSYLRPKTPHHCNLAICPETENSTDCAATIPVDLSVSAESGGERSQEEQIWKSIVACSETWV